MATGPDHSFGLARPSTHNDSRGWRILRRGDHGRRRPAVPRVSSPPVIVAAVAVAFFAQRLGAFLETSKLSAKGFVRFQRIIAKVALIGAGWCYLWLYLRSTGYFRFSSSASATVPFSQRAEAARQWKELQFTSHYGGHYVGAQANAYSLHQFYKDRLSKAFLVDQNFPHPIPTRSYRLKLSHIRVENCPYHIINAAMNVQGSTEANRRGRNGNLYLYAGLCR